MLSVITRNWRSIKCRVAGGRLSRSACNNVQICSRDAQAAFMATQWNLSSETERTHGMQECPKLTTTISKSRLTHHILGKFYACMYSLLPARLTRWLSRKPSSKRPGCVISTPGLTHPTTMFDHFESVEIKTFSFNLGIPW
jgi:hypothetical protein